MVHYNTVLVNVLSYIFVIMDVKRELCNKLGLSAFCCDNTVVWHHPDEMYPPYQSLFKLMCSILLTTLQAQCCGH